MKTGIHIIPRLLLLGTGIALLVILLNYLFGHSPSVGDLWSNFAYTQLYTFCLYFANAFCFRMLDKWFSDRFSVKRIVIGFVLSFVVSLLVVFALRMFEEVAVQHQTFEAFLSKETPANYIFAVVVTFVITLSVYSFGFYKAYQENRVKQQQIIAGRASAQFESLKNQIDPHFLFNSLNVLSALIEENQQQARKFTISLSKVYRYVLEQKDKELVSLSEELDFARVYMELLQTRFEKGLEFDLSVSEDFIDFKVVPLSLQLLLENAIKHNVVSASSPLKVKVLVEEGQLVVRNNLQKKQALNDRKGVGLENIASRYALLTNRKVRAEETDSFFSVRLPLLSRQVEVFETPVSSDDHAYLSARKQVEELRNFYGSALSFVVINGGLAWLNLVTFPQYLWFLWVTLSWGIGLVFQGLKAFNALPFLGSGWEERRVREIMNKEKNKENSSKNWN